jgi:hypothetical protein
MMARAVRSVMPRVAAMSHSRIPVAGDGQQDPGAVGQQRPVLHALENLNTGIILLVLYFQRRLRTRTRETPAGDGWWPPGSSKERAMFTVLIIIAALALSLCIGRRLRRHL